MDHAPIGNPMLHEPFRTVVRSRTKVTSNILLENPTVLLVTYPNGECVECLMCWRPATEQWHPETRLCEFEYVAFRSGQRHRHPDCVGDVLRIGLRACSIVVLPATFDDTNQKELFHTALSKGHELHKKSKKYFPPIRHGTSFTMLWDSLRRFGIGSIIRVFRLVRMMENHRPKGGHYYLFAI